MKQYYSLNLKIIVMKRLHILGRRSFELGIWEMRRARFVVNNTYSFGENAYIATIKQRRPITPDRFDFTHK